MIRGRRHLHRMKPLARTEGLSITVSGDETLVYDRERFVIHRLDAVTATIWRLADGSRDIAQLAEATNTSRRAIETALYKLASLELMEMDAPDKWSLSRRFLIGGVGAAVATYIPASAASSCSPHGAWGGQCRILNVPNGQNDMSMIQCVYGPDGKLIWHCIGAAWGQPWEPV